MDKINRKMYLIGFKISGKLNKMNFYCLLLGDNEFTPLHKKQKIIFFKDIKLSVKAFKNSDLIDCYRGVLPKKLQMVCDLVKTEKLIESSNIDRQAVILNTLNMLDDLICFLKINIPKKYRVIIYSLLDRLTFYRTFGRYLKENNLRRKEILEAVMWMKNCVLRNSIII